MNQLESPVHINFMGGNLTPVTEVKDLGMLLDSHLTYDKHIQLHASIVLIVYLKIAPSDWSRETQF
jgi:hypothetical protein